MQQMEYQGVTYFIDLCVNGVAYIKKAYTTDGIEVPFIKLMSLNSHLNHLAKSGELNKMVAKAAAEQDEDDKVNFDNFGAY